MPIFFPIPAKRDVCKGFIVNKTCFVDMPILLTVLPTERHKDVAFALYGIVDDFGRPMTLIIWSPRNEDRTEILFVCGRLCLRFSSSISSIKSTACIVLINASAELLNNSGVNKIAFFLILIRHSQVISSS